MASSLSRASIQKQTTPFYTIELAGPANIDRFHRMLVECLTVEEGIGNGPARSIDLGGAVVFASVERAAVGAHGGDLLAQHLLVVSGLDVPTVVLVVVVKPVVHVDLKAYSGYLYAVYSLK